MKLAFSTNAFTRFSLAEALRLLGDIGYEGVELMADRPHAWPPDLSDHDLDVLAETARDLDLALCNINAFMMRAIGDIHHPSWIEKEEGEREKRIRHTRACLEMAKRLGVPGVSTEPGGPLEGMAREEAVEIFAEGLCRVAPLAAELGVTLLLEPEPGLLFSDMDETVAFIDGIGLDGLGINADLGHFYCIGRDPASVIRDHGDRLLHVHIEDIAADRVHRHMIPGEGAMDFASIFQSLHEVAYRGFITVELYPYEAEPVEAAKRAYNHLRPFLEG